MMHALKREIPLTDLVGSSDEIPKYIDQYNRCKKLLQLKYS
jgi:hypothetical protein